MAKVVPLSTGSTLPDGIENSALDTALLVSRLRDLYRRLRFHADAAVDPAEQKLCYRLMHEIEQVMEDHQQQRRMWEAARDDVVREVVASLRRG